MFNSKNQIGIKKVRASASFEIRVARLAFQISFLFFFSDSFWIWIPKESLKASTKAIVRIPAITTVFEFVPIPRPILFLNLFQFLDQ